MRLEVAAFGEIWDCYIYSTVLLKVDYFLVVLGILCYESVGRWFGWS